MKKKVYISPKMEMAAYEVVNNIMITSIGTDYLPPDLAPKRKETEVF